MFRTSATCGGPRAIRRISRAAQTTWTRLPRKVTNRKLFVGCSVEADESFSPKLHSSHWYAQHGQYPDRTKRQVSFFCGCRIQHREFSSKNGRGDDTHEPDVSQDDLKLVMDSIQNEESSPDAMSADSEIPGTSTGKQQLAIVFTCNVCETRSAKRFTAQAYYNGVVIIQCPSCKSQHLIADRLGWFDEGKDWDIEQALATRGESVKTVMNDNVLEITVDDVAGEGGR